MIEGCRVRGEPGGEHSFVIHNLGSSASCGGGERGGAIVGNCGTGKARFVGVVECPIGEVTRRAAWKNAGAGGGGRLVSNVNGGTK